VNVYPFIEAEKAQQHSVKRACELLEVSRAAFYARLAGRRRAGRGDPGRAQGSPGAATAPRGCTPSCAAKGTGTAASGSPG
jgi:hypothetical protein